MRFSNRVLFGGLAALSLGLLAAGLLLGEIFLLQPCYWCNFQRLLYFVLAFVGICGALFPRAGKLWSLLGAGVALGGIIAAGRQSWMQYAPQDVTECGFGDPTLTEQLVDWLGGIWPSMFMVTGLCKEKDWVFLGLSLANWSGICFLGLLCAFLWMFRRREAQR